MCQSIFTSGLWPMPCALYLIQILSKEVDHA